MPQDPFPNPPGDAEEPDGCPLLPAAEEDGLEGMGQGLYVCLPAEQVTLAGFAQGGASDTMTPGPLLATVVHTVAGEDGSGLAGCSDDQLIGMVSGARRMQSWSAWTEMAAMAEFAARHPGTQIEDQFAADELAAELHLTPLSAAEQMGYASTVGTRLPRTFAALAAGQIHPVHLRIIEDETRVLTDADAGKADAILAEAAPGLTYGETRSAAHKVVLQLDPEAAKKRKEAARREAQVRRFREASGNAGLVARELPSDEVLASWQHVEQRALDLRAAGLPGSLQELRVRAYLDLLQERDSRDLPAASASVTGQPPSDGAPDQPPPGSTPDQPPPDRPSVGSGPPAPGAGSDGPGNDPPAPPGTGPDRPGGNDGDSGPGHGPGRSGPRGPAPAAGPSVAALVTLTIPLATYQGRSETPGQADGFGLLDGDDARDLAAAAARHPRTRWCLTVVNPDGTAVAHGCLPGRHPPPGLAAPGLDGAPGPAPPGTGPPLSPPALNVRMIPVARGPCNHARAETSYHPSRTLAHLIRARNATCTAPGCTRPAARCDLDHTRPWDQGGPTCQCNLAPLCRHHHRCKQAEGWQLEQPEPGVLLWRTPSGRTYATSRTVYPI
jgi:hypothetical protein